MCDDTARLRLRFFNLAAPGREYRGASVRVENGYPSFAVDGQCTYWMSGGWFNDAAQVGGRDQDWRTGQVDAELETALDGLPLEHLYTLADCVKSGIYDGAPAIISDGISGGGCLEAGPRFAAAWAIVYSRARELWASATPMTGGLRVSAVILSDGETSQAYPWPVEEPLKRFMLPDSLWSSTGVSRLVADVAAAAKLRALRAQYVEDRQATPGYFFDGQKMSDGVDEALVYMRDALPYEDEKGLLPLGPPE